MNKHAENRCKDCSTDQNCCNRLEGLRLTRAEYRKNFADYHAVLVVRQTGKIYRVSAKKGQSCPHWDGDCRIYDKRPIECRLYPYTISNLWEWGNHVFITFHSRTKCPFKEHLLIPRDAAKQMVAKFAREAFGGGCRPHVYYEPQIPGLISKIRDFLSVSP
ncbi:MAG: YkgJ family cysteine cluster protein [Syntrophobacterales bacterium]|nr:YkgJ family cysteine cluster protein [Syntrophobacterales bacterium]